MEIKIFTYKKYHLSEHYKQAKWVLKTGSNLLYWALETGNESQVESSGLFVWVRQVSG